MKMLLERCRNERRLAWVAIALLGLGGCTTVEHTYEEFSADQVWTAMVAVAETPEYDDWKVVANDVWVDEKNRRVEVYRQVRRVLYSPEAPPHPEQHWWRFEILLDKVDPPTVRFLSRGFAVPAHAWREADRYFADVHDVLRGVPGEIERDTLDAMGLDDTDPDATGEPSPDTPPE